jgi:hypothetical protein
MTTRSSSRAVKDSALADALAGGLSYRKAAEQVGYSLATVRRRMAESGFRRRVEEIRRGRLTAINDRLLASATSAVDRLVWLMDNGESHQVQARAAHALLAHARAYIETTDQEQRIQEIEGLLADDLTRNREGARHA